MLSEQKHQPKANAGQCSLTPKAALSRAGPLVAILAITTLWPEAENLLGQRNSASANHAHRKIRLDPPRPRATRPDARPDEPAFPTRTGGRRDRRSINRNVIAPAIPAANALGAGRREPQLPGSITAHTFRRTFITLMLEAGAPVPYVQAQVGHEDPTTTLQIYAQVHGEAFDALMSDAVPSGGSITIHRKPDRPEGLLTLDVPTDPGGFGHRNR